MAGVTFATLGPFARGDIIERVRVRVSVPTDGVAGSLNYLGGFSGQRVTASSGISGWNPLIQQGNTRQSGQIVADVLLGALTYFVDEFFPGLHVDDASLYLSFQFSNSAPAGQQCVLVSAQCSGLAWKVPPSAAAGGLP